MRSSKELDMTFLRTLVFQRKRFPLYVLCHAIAVLFQKLILYKIPPLWYYFKPAEGTGMTGTSSREVIMGWWVCSWCITAGSHREGVRKQTGLLHPQQCMRDCSFSLLHLKGEIFLLIYLNFFPISWNVPQAEVSLALVGRRSFQIQIFCWYSIKKTCQFPVLFCTLLVTLPSIFVLTLRSDHLFKQKCSICTLKWVFAHMCLPGNR